MDKIICQICGTSYPETSSQCPICGYAKPADAKTVSDDSSESGSYQYVKGGRFSSGNVRRRTRGKEEAASAPAEPERAKPAKQGSNFALGIVAIILLVILIIAIIWFIAKAVEGRSELDSGSTVSDQKQSVIVLQESEITLSQEGEMYILYASLDPADEDAFFSYTSSDPQVAVVDDNGTVTAIAEGRAEITVKCGKLQATVTVICSFPTEDTTPVDTSGLKLNREDITFNKKGSTWDLCGSAFTVPKNQVTWSSADESVAKIENGIVEAVGYGKTEVKAEYGGVTVSCTIRCTFQNTEETTPTEGTETASVSISHTDVTISVDESFQLVLRDENKNPIAVQWSASETGIVTIDGNKITGVAAGSKTVISTTYDGKTYQCTVRVKKQ